jgi:hypothetical protein
MCKDLVCSRCNGVEFRDIGIKGEEPEIYECCSCDYVETVYSDEDSSELLCGTCNGSGEGMHDGTRCMSCRGSGVVIEEVDDDDREEVMD